MKSLTRDQLLAAEIFSYSFADYAGHLGIGNIRFDRMMPEDVRILERAEKEGWSDERLAKALQAELSDVPTWRKRYQDAVEVIDAKSPAESFRNAVRQSLLREFAQHQVGDAQIETAVSQICYRAADLAYLLDLQKARLSDFSEELRHEE